MFRLFSLFFILLGLKQSCILTKTEPIFELPQRIVDSIGKVEIPDQVAMVLL